VLLEVLHGGAKASARRFGGPVIWWPSDVACEAEMSVRNCR
jgi:hypothetical protein